MIGNIYKGNYKLLVIPPLLLILISLFFIPQIKTGVDFRGGTLISLSLKNNIDAQTLQAKLVQQGLEAHVQVFETAVGSRAEIELPQNQQLVQAESLKSQFNLLLPTVTNLEIQSAQNSSLSGEYRTKKAELENISRQMFALSGQNQNNISGLNDLSKKFTASYSQVYKNYQDSISGTINKEVRYESISVQSVSPVLSANFIQKAINVVILSAILSVIFVFLFFRSIVPSAAVLTGALADVTIALGAMGLLGIPLTLQSFSALLMLIAFSLDTDILLTTRVLKRKGDLRENAYDAMKTGLTMSVMAVVAFGALFVLAIMTHIPTYYEISAVALAGLFGDMFATWGINGVMILHFAEKEREGGKA
ncbi:hypothetical protein HY988_05430 [Candidatus Micrarchaeota archaeon]|nr:hypothetical protein [Candidatus Micrarchaeota archaeon]